MTNRDWFVTFSVPDPTGPIEPDFTLASPPAGRTFRRRRLGLLTGVLVVTLGMGGLLSDGSGSSDTMVAAGAQGDGPSVVISESEGSATLAAMFAETTSTLLAVTTTTLAETPTTMGTTSTSTTSSSTTSSSSTSAAPTTAAPTTAAPTTAAPTTAPPTTAAPTTTAAPRPAPSTTAAPESSSSDSSYSDPNTLQVWLDLAECESGGNWSINTGNGYYGGLQFSLGTWESVGGSGYPHEHPRDTQIEFGRRLQARDGWGAWPHCSEELGLR